MTVPIQDNWPRRPRIKGLGWRRPDIYDSRDWRYTAPLPAADQPLPRQCSLRELVPMIMDQGALGSCTAFAVAQMANMESVRNGQTPVDPSTLFIYYNTRRYYEGTANWDSGAQIRNAIKAAADYGCPPTNLWPYDIARYRHVPPRNVYDAGLERQVMGYARVTQTREEVFRTIALARMPIMIGFLIYKNIESQEVARTGRIPMPKPGEQALGGHAVPITGYDEDEGVFEFPNSWGYGWGEAGYGYLPIDLVLNPSYASDFWVFSSLENLEGIVVKGEA